MEQVRQLKAVLLRYITTTDQVLGRTKADYDKSEIKKFIIDLRKLLGPWNGRLPTTLQLRNACARAQGLGDRTEDPLESAVLEALNSACATVAMSPSAQQAAEQLLKMHSSMLQRIAMHWPTDSAIDELLDKLDSAVRLRSIKRYTH